MTDEDCIINHINSSFTHRCTYYLSYKQKVTLTFEETLNFSCACATEICTFTMTVKSVISINSASSTKPLARVQLSRHG